MNQAKQDQVTWAEYKQLHPRGAQWLLMALALVVGLVIGSMRGTPEPTTVQVTKEVPVVREVTPQSCRDVLAIDDKVFITVGKALETMDYTDAVTYMLGIKDQRLSLYGQCLGKA